MVFEKKTVNKLMKSSAKILLSHAKTMLESYP